MAKMTKLTEQQILDKTIEYLNKCSPHFCHWAFIYEDKTIEAYTLIFTKRIYTRIEKLLDDVSYFNYNVESENFELESIFRSEFNIAYNIIKDLM